MVTELKVLQGAEQIGGNIILINGNKSRIFLDFGIPLTDTNGNPADISINNASTDTPSLVGEVMIEGLKDTIVLISHAHPDHYGLLRYLDKNIPIYTSEITKKLIETSSKILYEDMFEDLNLVTITEPIETEEFIIECFPVNHSIGGASSFMITDKSSGKKILYSGDLRCHGLSANDFGMNCNNADYMILEGTTLSRSDTNTKTEQDVEAEMNKVFKEDKLSIVCCSPLNQDRFLSVYNAAKNQDKTLVIDPYTALVLETYKNDSFPQYNSENIKVYCADHPQTKKVFEDCKNLRFGRNKISLEDIIKEPQKYVIKHNAKISEYILQKMNFEDINVIYSYWEGYLNKPNFWSKYRKYLKLIHTSGHIYEQDLISLVNKLNPKHIIPVHTLSNDRFKELFGEMGNKVLELHNGETLNIG